MMEIDIERDVRRPCIPIKFIGQLKNRKRT